MLYFSFISFFFHCDYAVTIGLHDDFTFVEVDVLKFVRHLRLQVEDSVHLACLQIPCPQDALKSNAAKASRKPQQSLANTSP